jgi:hypothetical protein
MGAREQRSHHDVGTWGAWPPSMVALAQHASVVVDMSLPVCPAPRCETNTPYSGVAAPQ